MNARKIKLLLVLATFLTALAGRWYALQRLPIGVDEPKYLNTSLVYANFMRQGDWKGAAWYDENAEHPAFAKLVYGAALLFVTPMDQIQEKDMVDGSPIQESEAKGWILWARAVSMVAGAAACALLAWLNPAAGLLMAVQTSAIRYTSLVGLEALPHLTSLLCILAYDQWIKKLTRFPTTKAWGWLAVSSIMLGLTAASKYVYCIVGIAILIHAVWYARRNNWPARIIIRVILFWGIGAVAIFFAANPFLWPRPISRLVNSVMYHFRFAGSEHVARYQYPFWQPLIYLSQRSGNANWYLLSADTLIFLLAIPGIFVLRKKPLMLIWLASALCFLLVWRTKWPQYVLVMMAPFCLAAGEGVLFFGERLRDRFINQE